MYKKNEEAKEKLRSMQFEKFYDFFKEIGNLEPTVIKRNEEMINFFEEPEPEIVIDNRLVAAFLDSMGIKKFGFLDTGNNALVFDIGNGQVLRLATLSEEKDRRPDIPQVLQPVYTKIVSHTRIEVLPKLNTKDVTKEHLQELAGVLKNSKYNFHDQALGEIGLLFDGTPVIVDGGAVLRRRTKKQTADIENDPRWKGRQEAHLEYVGLTKGEIKGANIPGKHTKRAIKEKANSQEPGLKHNR